MTDWKDYGFSTARAVSQYRPNFSNRRAISSRRVAISTVGDVVSPVTSALRKGYWRQEARAIV